MKVSVILGHPKEGSFNHAIAEKCVRTIQKNGHEVIYHDLYAEGYDPVMPFQEIPRSADLDPVIAKHCAEIGEADALVVVHPTWWEMPPAVLTGWVDRTFRPGMAYEFHEVDDGVGKSVSLLKIRKLIVLNTCNTPPHLRLKAEPLSVIWRDSLFGSTEPPVDFYRKTFGMIVTSSLEERKQWLNEVEEISNKYFPRMDG